MKTKSHYRNMTMQKANEIRERYFSGKAKQVELAREFACGQGSVSRIINFLTWVEYNE